MAMDARSINRLLVTHAKEAAKLEGRQADEFLSLLKSTREQLLGSLYGEYGSVTTALDWFRVRRIALETEAMIRSLEGKATRAFVAGQQTAAEMAVEHLQSELRAFAGSFQEPAFKIGLNAAKVWADPSQGLLADHFASSVQTYGSQLLNDIRRRLFVGVRSATPTREIIEEVAARQGPLGRIGAEKAETLVRTEVSQVFGTAQQGAIDESNRIVPGGRGKMWVHVGSYPCPTCMPLHGTTRPADGTWTVFKGKKYERTIAHPPAHPRCVPPGTLIATPTGEVRIEQLRVGDIVTGGLTGAPRRVTDTHKNQHSGGVVVVRSGGRELWLTDTHPVLTARGWVYAVELQAGDVPYRHRSRMDHVAAPSDAEPAIVATATIDDTDWPSRLRVVRGVPVHSAVASECVTWLPLVALRVDSIDRRPYSGTTHNLSVDRDESYVAEGAVVKNCVCRVAPMKRNWKSGLKRLGYLDEQDPADPESVDPEKV